METPNDFNIFNITINLLNDCIKKWFQKHLPQEYVLGEFKECCTNQERDIINKSITIFKQQFTSKQYTNEEIIKSIIIYYYVSIVLPYYAANAAEEKYNFAIPIHENSNKNKTGPNNEKFTDEDETKYDFNTFFTEGVDNGLTYVIDNDNNTYEVFKKIITIDGQEYIRIEDTLTLIMYYMTPNGKIYKKTRIYEPGTTNAVEVMTQKPRDYFHCLDILYTPNIRQIIETITTSDDKWASDIRRLVMNLNSEPFKGGKTRKRRNTNKKHKKSKRLTKTQITNKQNNNKKRKSKKLY